MQGGHQQERTGHNQLSANYRSSLITAWFVANPSRTEYDRTGVQHTARATSHLTMGYGGY